MVGYSLYSLDRNKPIVNLTPFDCVSDQVASGQAAALINNNVITLWRDERRLRRFDPGASNKLYKSSTSVPNPGIETELESGLALHCAGNFAEAAKGYANVLRADKHHARDMALLGTLHAQQGHRKRAVSLLSRSLEIDERQSFALNSLGNTLNALERYDDGLSGFDKSIALDSDQSALYSNGCALGPLKRSRKALAVYRKATTIDPTYEEAYR